MITTDHKQGFDARALVELARPAHHVKNLFIFLPLFFSGKLLDIPLLTVTLYGFVAMGLCASAVYVFNDLFDLRLDRQHPVKRHRPIASGRVTPQIAWVMFGALLAGGFSFAYLLAPQAITMLAAYVGLNLAYSIRLKHVALLDVAIIATGFVLRLWYGGAIGAIALSQWIVIMTFLLALFLALAKRRDDVLLFTNTGTKARLAVDGYNIRFLDITLGIMAAVTLVAYMMYCVSDHARDVFKTDNLYLTFAFVLLGILRYLQITIVEERSGSPTGLLLKDPFLRLMVGGWIAFFLVLIYLR